MGYKNNNYRKVLKMVPGALALAVAGAMSSPAHAGETISFNDGSTLDWSVVTTYGLGIRMRGQDAKLLSDANADDGNRNFKRHSLTSHRLTALGELVWQKDNYGAVLRSEEHTSE